MTSAIDATKPVTGNPTTQSVRDQFATARDEITALQAAVAGIGGGSITVSDTAPASPAPGALWWNSAVGVGQLFVYYADPNSSQWVIANQGVPGPPGLYQAGPGLTINSGTSPPTIDVATPYAPLDSPGLTGIPTAPTAATATNTTQLATTAFVKAQNYLAETGAWTAYTPTLTPLSGAFTSASASGRHKLIGKTCHVSLIVNITTNGTAAGSIGVSLPFGLVAGSGATFVGREVSVVGTAVIGTVAGSTVNLTTPANGYPGGNGYSLIVSGTYETV